MASLQSILALTRSYNTTDALAMCTWQKSGVTRFSIADDGELQLPNATASGQGLLLGTDAEIYRSAASTLTMPALTLGGAVGGGDQTWTNVGDMTFAAGSILASGAVNGNTLILRANDTTFITLTTGATDVCTMNAITMSGTWLASGTVTLPAFTTGGDIVLGTNRIKGTGVFLKEHPTDTNAFCTRNLADNSVMDFYARQSFISDSVQALSTGMWIKTASATDAYIAMLAQDTGGGLVEIGKMAGAADPFIRIGRDDTGVALNAVTDMLVLQAGGGTGNEAANFGLGTAWNLGNAASEVEKRGSIDMVLSVATNGAEETYFRFQVMLGGVLTAIANIDAGSINLRSGKVLKVNDIQVIGAQGVAVADASGGATVDAEARTAINTLLARVRAHGLIAT